MTNDDDLDGLQWISVDDDVDDDGGQRG